MKVNTNLKNNNIVSSHSTSYLFKKYNAWRKKEREEEINQLSFRSKRMKISNIDGEMDHNLTLDAQFMTAYKDRGVCCKSMLNNFETPATRCTTFLSPSDNKSSMMKIPKFTSKLFEIKQADSLKKRWWNNLFEVTNSFSKNTHFSSLSKHKSFRGAQL